MERNAQAKRERILSAALAEFAAKGLAGGRIDSIAAAAGCNKSLIFLYFESKATLFRTIVELQLERLAKAVDVAPRCLPALATEISDFASDNPDVLRLFAWHGLENGTRSPSELFKIAGNQLSALGVAPSFGEPGAAILRDVLLATVMSLGMGWSSATAIGEKLDCM